MDLLIISGFLGSGKTTILLTVAKALAASGRSIAIIENEVGSIGVDDQVIKEQGLSVREIYSGCICCSLRIDLINTLLELERTLAPDIVIMEPSGVAGPKQVIQSLYGYGGDIRSKIVISVIDTLRFGAIKDYSMPLISDGIEIADTVCLNKTDLAAQTAVDQIAARINLIRPAAPIIRIAASQSQTLTPVIDLISSKLSTGQTIESQTVIANASRPDTPQPAVAAKQLEFTPDTTASLEAKMKELVENIVTRAASQGCPLIGHVKAIVRGKSGYLTASVTDFNQPAAIKGAWTPKPAPATLTINAILYGLNNSAADVILSSAVDNFLAGPV